MLDALEQAIPVRGGAVPTGLVHHSDRGAQYFSMRYTSRLAGADIAPSVGSRGGAFDNALAESAVGLFKTDTIRHLGPWRSFVIFVPFVVASCESARFVIFAPFVVGGWRPAAVSAIMARGHHAGDRSGGIRTRGVDGRFRPARRRRP